MIPEHLKDRIASITIRKSRDEAHTVLPGTAAVLGFQLRGRVRAGENILSSAGVTGLQSTARRYEYLGETTSVLIRFTAQGATCLGAPASELSGQSLSLDDLLAPSLVRSLTARIQDEPEQAVPLIVSFLGQLPFSRDWLITRALSLLESLPPEEASISSIAKTLQLSERQLERRFASQVGVSPKKYMVLRRFEHAASKLATSSLTSAAFESGYYDQSHFIREFRRFTGTTPTEWKTQRTDPHR